MAVLLKCLRADSREFAGTELHRLGQSQGPWISTGGGGGSGDPDDADAGRVELALVAAGRIEWSELVSSVTSTSS